MSGYAANGTLHGIGPHVVHARSARPAEPAGTDPASASAWLSPPGCDHVELVGRPVDERLAEWWGGVRDAWSQATFFLFDPQSWR